MGFPGSLFMRILGRVQHVDTVGGVTGGTGSRRMKLYQAYNTETDRPLGNPGSAKHALMQAVGEPAVFQRDSRGVMWFHVFPIDGGSVEYGEFSEFPDDEAAENDISVQLIENQDHSKINMHNSSIIIREVAIRK